MIKRRKGERKIDRGQRGVQIPEVKEVYRRKGVGRRCLLSKPTARRSVYFFTLFLCHYSSSQHHIHP